MVRILVCGEVTDRFALVHPKIEALAAENGPFDLILLTSPVGKLSNAVAGLSTPTYFAALSHEGSSVPRKVVGNLYYVGPSAQFSVCSLSFLFSCAGAPLDSLSALIQNADLSPTAVKDGMGKHDSERLKYVGGDVNTQAGDTDEAVKIIDTEVSSQSHLQSFMDIVVTSASPLCSDVFAAHARKIGLSTRPRYHFSSAQAFVSLPPVRYKPATHWTRVISVARACQGRWAYAINIHPSSASGRVDNEGECAGEDLGYAKFGIYRLAGCKRGPSRSDDGVDGDINDVCLKRMRSMDDQCWFCIGDALERHLIVLRGEHIVATVAKGGLHESHLVIVPAAHIESSSSTGFSHEAWSQLLDVLNAVALLYSRHFPGRFPYLFERSGGESEDGRIRHMHIQSVAVENASVCDVRTRCLELARNFGVEARLQFVKNDSKDIVKGAKLCLRSVREQRLEKFFWAQLSVDTYVIIQFSGGCTVPVHFGRMVVAEAIGDDGATDWRQRVVSREEEGRLANKLHSILGQIVADMKIS